MVADAADHGDGELTLDLRATTSAVVRAVAAAVEQRGQTVEAIGETSDAAPGSGGAGSAQRAGYRLLARRPDADPAGPLLTVFDVVDAGGGVTRVRIVQCGFGDERSWQELAQHWSGRRRPPSAGGTGPRSDPSLNRWMDPRSWGWTPLPGEEDAPWSWQPRQSGLHEWPGALPLPPSPLGGASPPRLPGCGALAGIDFAPGAQPPRHPTRNTRWRALAGVVSAPGAANGADPELVAQVVRALGGWTGRIGRTGRPVGSGPVGREHEAGGAGR